MMTEQEMKEFREYSRRIDRMLKEHEAARAHGYQELPRLPQNEVPGPWVIATVCLALGALIFFAGMFAGAKLL